MEIRALCSFSGRITMAKGEIRDCDNEYVVNDLLRAGYVEAVEDLPPAKETGAIVEKETKKPARKKKAVAKNEDQ